MKKILAVLIAISMVATMAFAADFAFSVKTSGNVVAWDGTDVTLLSRNANESSATLSASIEDEAGVSATLKADGAGNDVNFTDASIWIKPVAGVKITFGAASYNVFDVDSDGTAEYGCVDADGFDVEYTGIENLTANVGIAQGFGLELPMIAAKVAYKLADAATVAVALDKDINLGVAVTGSAAGFSYGVAFDKTGDAMKVGEKASGDIGPVNVGEWFEYNVDGAMKYGVSASASFSPVTVSVAAGSADVAAEALDSLTVTPKLGFSGNIGCAAWTLGVEVPVAIIPDVSVTATVPYTVTIAF